MARLLFIGRRWAMYLHSECVWDLDAGRRWRWPDGSAMDVRFLWFGLIVGRRPLPWRPGTYQARTFTGEWVLDLLLGEE